MSPWQAGLIGVAAALAAGVAALSVIGREAPTAVDSLTAATLAPDLVQLAQPGHAGLVFTPKGSALVFAAVGEGQIERLYVRPLDGTLEKVIPGTDGGRTPAVSPDGQDLAFTANGGLMRVPLAGGRPVKLADAPHLHGIAWSSDGRDIYYVPSVTGGV